MLALGVAYQAGALPISASAIEQAIELNGVAVETNMQAFRWGRMLIADPDRLHAASTRTTSAQHAADPRVGRLIGDLAEGELGRLLSVRVPELAAYQDWDYAERYVDGVRAVAAAEATRTPGHTELAEAVARNLYKLMAYKDEYEVSRLHLDAAIDDQIATVADGRDMAASINLHPPILRAMGMKNKMKFGPNTRPVLKTLASMKKLRGTKLDMFGYAKVRRTERELIEEYRSVVDRLVDGLTAENHDASVRIAGLPDLVRGYEEVKMGNVERYHDELQRALAELEANGS
jgi:indolepyruvate ferredoxin oxidoreductase